MWINQGQMFQLGFPGGSDGKESTYNAGDVGSIPGLGRSSEEGTATHSSILAWRIPWTEEPGRLQSMGLQRVGHDWATNTYTQPVIQFSLIGNVFSFLYYGIYKFRKNVEMAQIHPIFRVRHFLNYLKFKDLFCFYFFLWKRTLKKNIQ